MKENKIGVFAHDKGISMVRISGVNFVHELPKTKWGKDGNEHAKMDEHYSRYDENETVITLKFNKRSDVDINSFLCYFNLGLKHMDYLMKDLDIEVK